MADVLTAAAAAAAGAEETECDDHSAYSTGQIPADRCYAGYQP